LHHAFVVRYFTAWVETSDETDQMTETSGYSYPVDDAASSCSSEDGDWMTSSGGRRISESSDGIVFEMSGSGAEQELQDEEYSIPEQMHSPIELPRVLFIQMEYCEQKTLRDVIDEGIENDVAWKFFRQILEGMS
jgi:translation initiation factor 2-alpha kinase 4